MPNISVIDTTVMFDQMVMPRIAMPIMSETTPITELVTILEPTVYPVASDTTVMNDMFFNVEEEQDINLGTANIIKNYRYISAVLMLAQRAARQATLFNNTTVGSRNYQIRQLLADVDGTQQTNINIAIEILNIVRGDNNQDISTS